MSTRKKSFVRVAAAVFAAAACFTAAGCADGRDVSESDSVFKGLNVTGTLGEKPSVSISKPPITVKDKEHKVVQEGNGDVLEDGQSVCLHQIMVDASTGKELTETWSSNNLDCSTRLTKESMAEEFYNMFKGLKINTSLAIGIKDSSDSSTASAEGLSSTNGYINILTIVSAKTIPTRAWGEKVNDIPDNLPKITLANNGEPSIDMNGYTAGDSLVVQPLMQGDGKAVEADDEITVHYSGWIADGTLFDSSWQRGQNTNSDITPSPASFKLKNTVAGWQQGLAGQKVGSQVLLVIPPSLGYGNQEQNKIPANSTLFFVVDILDAY